MPPAEWYRDMGGHPLVAFYTFHGIAASTRSGYGGAQRSYTDFCRLQGYRSAVLPAPLELVKLWVAQLGMKGERRLKQRVTGLKSWHTDLGLNAEPLGSESLRRIMRGVLRYHGVKAEKQALPVTLPVLRKVVSYIRLHPHAFGGLQDSMNLVAAFLLAFAGFLRGANYTYDSYDPDFDLAVRHVHLDSETPYVYVPASKTDPFRTGVNVYLPVSAPADVCPVRALRVLLRTYPRDARQPLFSLANGSQPFKRAVVVDVQWARAVRECGIPGAYSAHSFRRGAATWAKSVGCADGEIQAMGRWKSDAFKRYTDITPAQRREQISFLYTAPSTLPASGLVHPSGVFDPDF